MKQREKRWIVTVLTPDRVGVLRDVTKVVAGLRGNIDGFRQSIVSGLYSLVLTVTFPDSPDPGELDRQLRASLGLAPGQPALLILPYGASEKPSRPGSIYVAMIRGKDRPGVLYRIASFLTRRNINIEDWQVEFDGDEVTHIGRVTVPGRIEISSLREEFRLALEQIGLRAALCHENIFRATNEIHGLEITPGSASDDQSP